MKYSTQTASSGTSDTYGTPWGDASRNTRNHMHIWNMGLVIHRSGTMPTGIRQDPESADWIVEIGRLWFVAELFFFFYHCSRGWCFHGVNDTKGSVSVVSASRAAVGISILHSSH